MEAQPMYNYKVIRQFALTTVLWGIVGMAVGMTAGAVVYSPLAIGAVAPVSAAMVHPLFVGRLTLEHKALPGPSLGRHAGFRPGIHEFGSGWKETRGSPGQARG